jgi:molybdopterin-binding protein
MILPPSHASILSGKSKKVIDLVQLDQLEQSFRTWAGSPSDGKRLLSRLRIVLIFLIIRYTGARLNEVLMLNRSEVVVQISDNTELCSILTEKSRKELGVIVGDTVWAVFNASSVVINVD